jgi:hypothetical protein
MQSVTLELADAHLRRAIASSSPFAIFDGAWLAFTQLYQLERGQNLPARDHDLVRREVERLQGRVDRLLNQVSLYPLVKIEPSIFDEKIREETGVLDRTRHNVLKKRVHELASRPPVVEDLHALLDVIYLIRCNLFKGYKLHDSARDQEILAAAAPLLLEVALELRGLHEEAVMRPA